MCKEQPNEQSTWIAAKLKFIKSENRETMISFVSQNTKDGRLSGVRENDPLPKKICIADKLLAPRIVPNVLYDVAMVPMHEKNGYIVLEAVPVKFEARIETTYVPKSVYVVEVKFGNKTIRFDPYLGRNRSVSTLEGCLKVLEERMDLKNKERIVEEFKEAAAAIMAKYRNDGLRRFKNQ
jgi:hypothetical protein